MGKETINLFKDVFGRKNQPSIHIDDMNFLAHKYVIEIEVIRLHTGVEPVSSYLRYVTCNNIQ